MSTYDTARLRALHAQAMDAAPVSEQAALFEQACLRQMPAILDDLDALRAAGRQLQDYRKRLLASAARAVREALDAGHDGDRLHDHWALVLTVCAHPGWPEGGEAQAEASRKLLTRLLHDPDDADALWRLTHHPDARPGSKETSC